MTAEITAGAPWNSITREVSAAGNTLPSGRRWSSSKPRTAPLPAQLVAQPGTLLEVGVEARDVLAGELRRARMPNRSANAWLACTIRPSARRTIATATGWLSAMVRKCCSLSRSACSIARRSVMSRR